MHQRNTAFLPPTFHFYPLELELTIAGRRNKFNLKCCLCPDIIYFK